MNEEYLIPIAIDAEKVVTGFREINAGAVKLAADMDTVNKEIQQGFNQSAQAADKFTSQIKKNTDFTKAMSAEAKTLGAELGKALNGDKVGNDLESKLKKFTDAWAAFADRTKVKLPFNVDTAALERLEQLLLDAGDDLQTFQGILTGAEAALSQLDPNSEEWEALNNQLQIAREFLNGLASVSKEAADAQKQVAEDVEQLKRELQETSAAAKTTGETFQTVFDDVKSMGSEIDAAASKGAAGMERLNTIADDLEQQQSLLQNALKRTFDPALQANYSNALKIVEGDLKKVYTALDNIEQQKNPLDEVGKNVPKTSENFVKLNRELRSLKQEIAALELSGQGDPGKLRAMTQRAAELEDQIGDVSQRVKALASDTKYIDAGVQAITGLTAGFTAATGVLALFGDKNEDVEKVVQKLAAGMAILNSIQALANVLNKDGIVMTLLRSRAETTATVSTTALAGATTAEAAATATATTATQAFTAALLANPITAVLVAITAIVGALLAFTDGSEDAEEATKRLNDALERQNTLLELDEADLRRRTDLLVAQSKAQGKAQSDQTRIEGQSLQSLLKIRQDALNETRDLLRKALDDRNTSAEDLKQLQDKEIKQEQTVKDTITKIQVTALEQTTQLAKEAADREKKADEERKKRAEARKAILAQEIKFLNELEKARIDSMAAGINKEKELAVQAAEARIRELEAEAPKSALAAKRRNDLILQVRANLNKQLEALDKKALNDRTKLEFEAENLRVSMLKEGEDQQRQALAVSYQQRENAIREQFKLETDLRDKLLKALAAQRLEAEKALEKEINANTIKKAEELAILEVETASKYLKDLPGVEEQKQEEILRVRLLYAKKQLDSLISQGEDENGVAVLQAKKVVNDLTKELNAAVEANAGKVDWFKIMGLGNLSTSQRAAIAEAAKSIGDSFKSITSDIIEGYQRQIDKKAEVIRQYDKDISDLDRRLQDEKRLQEEGLANNVALLEQELAEKQKAKDEEVKQAEELQKKQAEIAKLQLAVDTAVQASNLITASAKIFNSLASLGPIGVGIAIATIAAMTAAFAASRIKAFQLVNEQKQTFADGGYVDGPSHSAGGVKYRSVDGSGGVVEMEGGEFVVNKRSTAKYGDVLEAMNEDGNLSNAALLNLLAGTGVRPADTEENEIAASLSDEVRREQVRVNLSSAGLSLESLPRDLAFVADWLRKKKEIYTDGDKTIIEQGAYKTIIRK